MKRNFLLTLSKAAFSDAIVVLRWFLWNRLMRLNRRYTLVDECLSFNWPVWTDICGLGITTPLGRWWSSSRSPCTQQPVLSTLESFAQRRPQSPPPMVLWANKEYGFCLSGPHYYVWMERRGTSGNWSCLPRSTLIFHPWLEEKSLGVSLCLVLLLSPPSLTKWMWCSTGGEHPLVSCLCPSLVSFLRTWSWCHL